MPGDGRIEDSDDPLASSGDQERVRVSRVPFTYAEVGASAGELPAGYRHVDVERCLGAGSELFHAAVERLMTWDMHRRAALMVDVNRAAVAVGQVAVLSISIGPVPIKAPVRVVDVVTQPTVQGFAYGTLPGHPEAGEERFLIHHDPDDGVRATIRAFSRPARWYAWVGGPLARRCQDQITNRYLDALDTVR